MLGSLCHDLILLENQIPFIVLEALFNLSNVCDETLNKHVALFFESILAMEQTPLNRVTKGKHLLGMNKVTEAKHLLDLLRNCLFPSLPRANRGDKSNWEFTKCATNLSQAGVKFEKNEEDSCRLFNIELSRTTTGVLQIPPLTLKSVSFVLLLNLIALEQCIGHDDLVTSYVVFIDSLIN
ncbi:hypothetical protein Sjap_012317 [Stephania japonica]|uniref:Uncharacterized protein n=1 Tax=Stephania japonica TaxID=461633 RepID=A0AAP0IWY0_9MAGN